jgi:hypothetical protein
LVESHFWVPSRPGMVRVILFWMDRRGLLTSSLQDFVLTLRSMVPTCDLRARSVSRTFRCYDSETQLETFTTVIRPRQRIAPSSRVVRPHHIVWVENCLVQHSKIGPIGRFGSELTVRFGQAPLQLHPNQQTFATLAC